MLDMPNLRPATRDELMQALSFTLRFNGRRRVHAHTEDLAMARVTAEPLLEHLERSGYVVMHKPPLGQHGAPGNLNLPFAWDILRHQLAELWSFLARFR